MDKDTRESLDRVIHYLEDAERKHWLDMGKPVGHIYSDILELQGWLIYRTEYGKDKLQF